MFRKSVIQVIRSTKTKKNLKSKLKDFFNIQIFE